MSEVTKEVPWVRVVEIQGHEPWRKVMEELRESSEGEWILMRVETQAKDRESVRSGLKQAGYRRLAHTGHSFAVRIPDPPKDGQVEFFISKTRRRDAVQEEVREGGQAPVEGDLQGDGEPGG